MGMNVESTNSVGVFDLHSSHFPNMGILWAIRIHISPNFVTQDAHAYLRNENKTFLKPF